MTTPRDAIGLSEPTQEQTAACERAMDALEAQADIWAEEIALVNIVKNLGAVSRGLTDRMPSDVRAGFINRQEAQIDALARQAYLEGFDRGAASRKEYDDAKVAEAATQLDALSARVKELERDVEAFHRHEQTLRDNGIASHTDAVVRVVAAESRATRAEQERDEALERAASIIDAECERILAKQTPTNDPLSTTDTVNLNLRMMACILPDLAVRIRQLKIAPGPDKEKRE